MLLPAFIAASSCGSSVLFRSQALSPCVNIVNFSPVDLDGDRRLLAQLIAGDEIRLELDALRTAPRSPRS